MQRSTAKIDDSHSAIDLLMESTGEYQDWTRAVPDPLPSTHALLVEWRVNNKGMKYLHLEPVKKVAKAAETAKPAEAADPHSGVREAVRAELDAIKDDADLETYVVEKGAGPWPRKGSRAQKIAEVADRLVTIRAAGANKSA